MRKKYYIIALLFIIIALGSGYLYFGKTNNGFFKKEIKVERNLRPEQEKVYTDRIKESEEFIKKLDPQNKDYARDKANAYLFLGQQYFGLGELGKSMEFTEQAAKLDPQNYNIFVFLSLVQTEAKEYQNARDTLNIAVNLAPMSADVHLRQITLIKGSFPEEKNKLPDFYEQALKATSRHIDIITSFAKYSEEAGDTEKAKSLWQEAMKKEPDNLNYLAEYKRLGGK